MSSCWILRLFCSCLSVWLAVWLSGWLAVRLFVCLSSLSLSLCPLLSPCPSARRSVRLPLALSLSLFVPCSPPVRLPAGPFVCLFVPAISCFRRSDPGAASTLTARNDRPLLSAICIIEHLDRFHDVVWHAPRYGNHPHFGPTQDKQGNGPK